MACTHMACRRPGGQRYLLQPSWVSATAATAMMGVQLLLILHVKVQQTSNQ